MNAIIKFSCPRCGYYMDAASAPDDDSAIAEPGDLSLCLVCAAPLCFAETEPPRWLTFQEIEALPVEQRVNLVRIAMAILTQRPSRVVLKRLGQAKQWPG